jgi:bacterioferritin
MDKDALIERLNEQLEHELEGVSRYLHHSFMVFGLSRGPMVNYFRTQATEGLTHATRLGEKIVSLGGHPSVRVEARWEPEQHSLREMLEINLKAEREALKGYLAILETIPRTEVALEEMIRELVREEQEHLEELQKYLRSPDKG